MCERLEIASRILSTKSSRDDSAEHAIHRALSMADMLIKIELETRPKSRPVIIPREESEKNQ